MCNNYVILALQIHIDKLLQSSLYTRPSNFCVSRPSVFGVYGEHVKGVQWGNVFSVGYGQILDGK